MTNEKNDEVANAFKHDVKNQLSSITLALEQLRYEIPELTADTEFYLKTISSSCFNINKLVNEL